MKHRMLILVCYTLLFLVTGVFAAAFFLPFALWEKMPETPMNVWIVDKTVPNTEYREHKGLTWAINSLKIVDETTRAPLSADSSYYGAIPIKGKPLEVKALSTAPSNPDLIYLADSYGVYKDDYFAKNIEGARSELLYGGLQEEELSRIRKNLGHGNTIVGEFNIASSPTNLKNREQLGEMFHLSWKGWSGRYFKDLTKGVEVPVWTVESYENDTGKAWNFSGEGYVFVSDGDKVFVLKKGTATGKKGLEFAFEKEYREEFGASAAVPYEYWFEFTKQDPSAEVLASYSFDLTAEGKEIFQEYGLPEKFPAIIRSVGTQYTSYYCAGDFADATISDKWWNYYGFAAFKKVLPFASKGDNNKFFWKSYMPLLTKIMADVKERGQTPEKPLFAEGELSFGVKTSGAAFYVEKEGVWQEFFVKGVNIGTSVPGKWFTEFSKEEGLYYRWLSMIGDMNANSVRVYTLLPPQFYSAFAYYNRMHPENPLLLYQEIWPEENPAAGDYLAADYEKAYKDEIRNVIDAIHGRSNIPERTGRAFGVYNTDVSPYLAGYLVGRELEPEEVISTNEKNPGYAYSGRYLYTKPSASPCEAWLAMNCGYALEYETDTYNSQHPVGIVSWPTLDPKEHDSEFNAAGKKELEYNDKVDVDINEILVTKELETGFFGGYHIYPNYPDFMNNEESYAKYADEKGTFRYGGYLQEFMEGHKKYPALVAEFGISTGMGNAHTNPDGYNHGGLTEEAQGKGIARMLSAIKREGYAGGLIFEWADEWAKKTWTTEPYIIPFDRNPLWHNAVDPEQNYGILAMESAGTRSAPYTVPGTGLIRKMDLKANETYLTMILQLKRPIDWEKEDLILGLDTYDRQRGDVRYAEGLSALAPSGMEFTLRFSGREEGRLLVHPGYNVTKGKFASYASAEGNYETLSVLLNKERVTVSGKKIPAEYEDESVLRYGTFRNNSYNHWYEEGNFIHVRIPWSRLNVSDPSSRRVIHDEREGALLSSPLETEVTEGIVASGVVFTTKEKEVLGQADQEGQIPFTWDLWDIPDYEERLKGSYSVIRDCFSEIR